MHYARGWVLRSFFIVSALRRSSPGILPLPTQKPVCRIAIASSSRDLLSVYVVQPECKMTKQARRGDRATRACKSVGRLGPAQLPSGRRGCEWYDTCIVR